jgi:hypothetical protein
VVVFSFNTVYLLSERFGYRHKWSEIVFCRALLPELNGVIKCLVENDNTFDI